MISLKSIIFELEGKELLNNEFLKDRLDMTQSVFNIKTLIKQVSVD
jgi:hypothetical protein